jgi:1,4-dihydroxy-2-naphthoyl-CoA synthase
LVASDRLESFTLELAATMATKSPLAIAVIKEQLSLDPPVGSVGLS